MRGSDRYSSECAANVLPDFGYCGDHLADYKIMYLQGKNGELVNMDIDCDGALGEGDGSCDSSGDTQPQTTFQETVAGYNKGIKDLNAYIHSFVVLGNDGSKNGYIEFKPEQYGIEPLSTVAVVCGDKMVSTRRLDEEKARLLTNVGKSSMVSGEIPTAMTARRSLARCPIPSVAHATAAP